MTLTIEIVYVPPSGQTWHCVVQGRCPYTARQALQDAGLLRQFPEIELGDSHKIGVFGKMVSYDTVLADQDRLEIYRPLAQDPKVLRRLRAKQDKQSYERRKHARNQSNRAD